MDTGSARTPAWVWKIALTLSAAIWGGVYVVAKGALDDISPTWLLALRFCATTAVLAALFGRRLRERLDADHLRRGCILGAFSGFAFVLQFAGLAHTTPGKSAFLTATYCVLVPFLNWALARRRPEGLHVLAALLAVIGIGLISLGEGLAPALAWGDAVTLACAVLFGLHIVYVARCAPGHDIIVLTIVQIAASAAIALAFAAALEPVPDLAALGTGFWYAFAYLVILSSCVSMVVQNVAQSIVEPATAALILSLESVFAVVFSVIFYHEQLTARLVAGFALIFAAVLASEVLPGKRREGP